MDRLGGMKSDFEKVLDEYKASGRRFQVVTHPYYSTVGFEWLCGVPFQRAPGDPIKIPVALVKGQVQEFFGYGLKDQVGDFGLPPGGATDAYTNMQVKNRTNTEDVVIEGLSASCIGHRIEYNGVPDAIDLTSPFAGMFQGTTLIDDPGANILPPEVDSPLLLEQGLFGKLAKVVSLNPVWNRRAEDHIGTIRMLPEGGGASYLRANGEPTHHNFWRLPEGWEWEKEGAAEDTMFSMNATVSANVAGIVTLPQVFQAGDLVDETLKLPTRIWTHVQLMLHTRSFYEPSKNA